MSSGLSRAVTSTTGSREKRGEAAHRLGELEAVHARHLHVRHERVGARALQSLPGLGAVRARHHLVAGGLQQALLQGARGGRVLGQQDALALALSGGRGKERARRGTALGGAHQRGGVEQQRHPPVRQHRGAGDMAGAAHARPQARGRAPPARPAPRPRPAPRAAVPVVSTTVASRASGPRAAVPAPRPARSAAPARPRRPTTCWPSTSRTSEGASRSSRSTPSAGRAKRWPPALTSSTRSVLRVRGTSSTKRVPAPGRKLTSTLPAQRLHLGAHHVQPHAAPGDGRHLQRRWTGPAEDEPRHGGRVLGYLPALGPGAARGWRRDPARGRRPPRTPAPGRRTGARRG